MDVKKFKDLVAQTWEDLPKATLSENPKVTEKVNVVSLLDSTVSKMATTHVGLLISLACSCLDEDECYVNIGTWKGYSFFAGFINNPEAHCIGNDDFSLFINDRAASKTEKDPEGRNFGDTRGDFYETFNRLKKGNQIFLEKDWQEVFKDFPKITDKKIGFYFYDGDHSFEAQYKAFLVAKPYLSEKCVILIDDTNREDIKKANEKFLSENKDFKILYDLPTPCNRYPTWWDGLQIIIRE